MIFDYQEMIKEAEEIGQPVTRVHQLGCHDNTPASVAEKTIDTMAKIAPSSRCYHGYQTSFAPMRYTRAQLKYLIVKWLPRQQPCKTKDCIALVGKDSFSLAFDNVLGTANTTSIYGPDDDLVKEAMFEALLELESSRQFRSDNNPHLQNMLNIKEGWSRDAMTVFGELGTDNELKWSINHGRTKGTSWIKLLCALFNLSRMDALATLANFLGMKFKNLYYLSSEGHAAELNDGSLQDEDVPASLHLPGLPTGSACAELVDKTYIYGNAGQIIGAILRYRLNGNDFCLPATVGRGVLCVGKYKPTAHFLNQHLVDKHPLAPIVLCQDMRAALALQRLLEEVRGYTPDVVIVTAHIGSDLSVLPWNYFYDHDVVFVPAPTKVCMAMVKLYRGQVEGAGARSFKVCKRFLLPSCPDYTPDNDIVGVTEAEAELLHTVVVLDAVERPVWQVQQAVKDSVSYDVFEAWGQQLGIFKAPKETSAQTSMASTFALPPADPALTPAPAHSLADVTLHHTMRSGNYIMLLGAKGAGKTQVALSTCRSILKGNAIWPLFRGTGIADNVVYIDAETPYDEYCANLEQHGLAGEAGHRFFGISKFAPGLPEFCETFSLTDAKFREGLLHYLLTHQCRYVFLDNLTALMGDAVHQGKAAQEVLDWVENLQKYGLCVVLVHHKSEYETIAPQKDKARGSQLFIIRARTVIGLVNKEEILDACLGTAAVQESALQDGLTIGIRYQVSKPAPILERKTFWLYLPLGASEWKFLAATGADGKEIMLSMEEMTDGAKLVSEREGSPVVSSNAHFQPTTEHDLSPDERRVVEALRKEPSKRHKVQEQTGVAEDKALALLHSLINRNLVVKKGEGKATYYSLKPNV